MLSFEDFLTKVEGQTFGEVHPGQASQQQDLKAAFLLGMRKALELKEAAEENLARMETDLRQYHQLKTLSKPFKQLLATAGMMNTSEKFTFELLSTEEPFPLIEKYNQVTLHQEATEILRPLGNRVNQVDLIEQFQDDHYHALNSIDQALFGEYLSEEDLAWLRKEAPRRDFKPRFEEIYTRSNRGKMFLSVDMKAANWNALRYWFPFLPTWENFIEATLPASDFRQFLIKSKKFRQVALGILFRKYKVMDAIQTTQLNLIEQAKAKLPKWKLKGQSHDELVYQYIPRKYDLKPFLKLEKDFVVPIRITSIKMEKILTVEENDVFLLSNYVYSENKSYKIYRYLTIEIADRMMAGESFH